VRILASSGNTPPRRFFADAGMSPTSSSVFFSRGNEIFGSGQNCCGGYRWRFGPTFELNRLVLIFLLTGGFVDCSCVTWWLFVHQKGQTKLGGDCFFFPFSVPFFLFRDSEIFVRKLFAFSENKRVTLHMGMDA